jgi:hypothetical protein
MHVKINNVVKDITPENIYLAGYKLITGQERYACPVCNGWYPDAKAVVECLTKYHKVNMFGAYALLDPVTDKDFNQFYHIAYYISKDYSNVKPQR